MKIKIVVVDDHDLIRKSIRSMLEREIDFEVTGEAGNAFELYNLLDGGAIPDVVITDLNMPGENGIAVVKRLKNTFPDVKTLILSSEDHELFVSQAMQAGASGYLLKDSCEDELIFAVQRAFNEKKYICSDLALKLLKRVPQRLYN